jgi:hypothetical protein
MLKNGPKRELEQHPIGLKDAPPKVRDSKRQNTRLLVRTKLNESTDLPEACRRKCRPRWKRHAQYRVHVRAEGSLLQRPEKIFPFAGPAYHESSYPHLTLDDSFHSASEA